ncbi:het domain protein [Moniliophthora roreri]|uniref:Heterokaryon incompatibility domain-containing protein n=1 Tax=Moniliophthora roreri TaxID=221103 RepID=A0A0W0F1F3_MONRR|nr:het domain protein [Moniliophthora roreri]
MKLLERLQECLAKRYWNGKLQLKPRKQLAYPSNESRPEFIPVTAPYLCAPAPYDNAGFWDFPIRAGWKVHRVDRQCHSGKCPPGTCIADGVKSRYGLQVPAVSKADARDSAEVAEKIGFLQAWLFFGALTEVCSLCGLEFDVKDVLVGDVVNTAWLNGLPMRWFNAAKRRGLAGSKDLKHRINSIARQVQLIITRADEFEDEHAYTFSECQVLCSIHILLRILLLAVLCHSSEWFIDPKETAFSIGDVSSDRACEGEGRMAELMFNQLLAKGWCKSEFNGLGNAMMFFNFFIERPKVGLNHGDCTETRCMASQTSEDDYQTVHVGESCNCDFISVDQDELLVSLSRQHIPKIIVTHDCRLSVVEDEAYPYVAISHVWADGLGNPHENALPRCQLQRLRNFILALSSALRLSRGRPIAMWMDTLCIPVYPQHREYRKLAIRLLAPTYRDATAVLVLDRQFSCVNSQGMSDLEIGIRIISGGWVKRLWTLQEAALTMQSKDGPGKIHFQMADGPILWDRSNRTFRHVVSKHEHTRRRSPKPNALVSTVQEIKESLLFELWIEVSIGSRLPSVKDLQPAGWETQFQRLAYAVQNRATSKVEDEAICLASLAGIDVSTILDVSSVLDVTPMLSERTAEQRMQRLYLALREIPSAVIFLRNPALATPDYIPTPLMITAPFRWAPRSLLLHQTEIMNIHAADAQRRFSDVDYRMNGMCMPDGLHIEHAGFLFHGSSEIPSSCSFEDMDSKEVYRLTRHDVSVIFQGQLALIFETSVISTAVIVSVEKYDEDELRVTMLGHGSVSRGEQREGEVLLRGVLKAYNQRWCLT